MKIKVKMKTSTKMCNNARDLLHAVWVGCARGAVLCLLTLELNQEFL